MTFKKLNPVPSWFAHNRCSSCEHFLKLTVKCQVQKASDPCDKSTGHQHYKPKKKVDLTKTNTTLGDVLNAPKSKCQHPNLQPPKYFEESTL